MPDLDRKNELNILELRGEVNLLSQKVETLKVNDLAHIQKSVDGIQRILWAVGVIVLGHLGVAVKSTLW
jgi:hypothetical protein|tara:strand:+ start:296 stop:502 length:207 start_codon:yes stop_codon:yes gene_type:complete